MLPTPDEIQNMTNEQKEAHLLANASRAFGIMEASALHDPKHSDAYRERFDIMVDKLEKDWGKLSPEAQEALNVAISETNQGFLNAEVVNVMTELLGPPIEL